MLEFRDLLQEPLMLFLAAKSHHRFDDRAVIPTAVEKHDFAFVGQLPDIPLEVPLSTLIIRRLRQRHHTHRARIQMLGKSADRATLPGRIPSLDKNGDTLAIRLHPTLKPDQFNLQLPQLLLIQQCLAHLVEIDILILDQLEEALSRVDASEIFLRQGAPRLTDQSSGYFPCGLGGGLIAISFARHRRGNNLQFIRFQLPVVLRDRGDRVCIGAIFPPLCFPTRLSVDCHTSTHLLPGELKRHVPVTFGHGLDVIRHTFNNGPCHEITRTDLPGDGTGCADPNWNLSGLDGCQHIF